MLNFMHMSTPVGNNKSIKFLIYWLICFPEMEYKVEQKKGQKWRYSVIKLTETHNLKLLQSNMSLILT